MNTTPAENIVLTSCCRRLRADHVRIPGQRVPVGPGHVLRFLLAASLFVVAAPPAFATETVAILQGLDKITARISRIEAPVDTPVRFGTLTILVRDCKKRPPEEPPESAAFLEIDEKRAGDDEPRRVFSGWMFASSPALSAMEHPVYDINVLDCIERP